MGETPYAGPFSPGKKGVDLYLYLHVHGTHVHHLNYGIFLLSAVGGLLLFLRPLGRGLTTLAILIERNVAKEISHFDTLTYTNKVLLNVIA